MFYPHSPRANAALIRLADMVQLTIGGYCYGDMRDHAWQACLTSCQIWHEGQRFEFDSHDVYGTWIVLHCGFEAELDELGPEFDS